MEPRNEVFILFCPCNAVKEHSKIAAILCFYFGEEYSKSAILSFNKFFVVFSIFKNGRSIRFFFFNE